MKSKVVLMFSVLTLSACQGESMASSKGGGGDSALFNFEIKLNGQPIASEQSDKARIKIHQDGFWELSTKDVKLRMSGRFRDSSPNQTSEFRDRNNALWLTRNIDGKPMKIGCKPGKEAHGQMQRSNTGSVHNGSFSIVFTSCVNHYTDEAVQIENLPWTVEGTFMTMEVVD